MRCRLCLLLEFARDPLSFPLDERMNSIPTGPLFQLQNNFLAWWKPLERRKEMWKCLHEAWKCSVKLYLVTQSL